MLTNGKKLAAIGVAGGALTLGAVALGGAVFAQTGGGGTGATPALNARQQARQASQTQFYNDLAKQLNIDSNTLTTAVLNTDKQEIQNAVTSGKITQAQADQLIQKLTNAGVPPFGGGFADGMGIPGGLPSSLRQSIMQATQTAISNALGGETQAQI